MTWEDNAEAYWERICTFFCESTPDPEKEADAFAAHMKKFVVEFEKLIAAATFDLSHPILMLGDILADRGPNDWFILLLLSVLNEKGVEYRINFSNHDFETYCWAMFDKFSQTDVCHYIFKNQCTSLINFASVYHYCSDTRKKRMRDTYCQAYLPYVTLFAYSYDNKNKAVTVTTHAPSSESLLCDVATEFGIEITDLEKPTNFIKLIVACNEKFKNILINDPQLMATKYCQFPSGENKDKEQHYPAILRAIWGRNYEFTEGRHRTREDYSKIWLCGHLGPASHPLRVTNLDSSSLGKADITEGNLCYSTCAPDIVTNIPAQIQL
jgi:REP element-mobilizing transposase RayT